MNKLLILSTLSTVFLAGAPGVLAQQAIRTDSMERARWYNAPREIQITDDRPVVRDFREAPSTPGSIMLPPGPAGNAGVLPSGGLQMGGGYRTPQGSGPIGLPKSGFGSQSNIPNSLVSPRSGLPNGTSSGVMNRGQRPPAQVPRQPTVAGKPAARPVVQQPAAPTQVMTYGGGYGGGSASSGQTTKTGVKGTLLSRIK